MVVTASDLTIHPGVSQAGGGLTGNGLDKSATFTLFDPLEPPETPAEQTEYRILYVRNNSTGAGSNVVRGLKIHIDYTEEAASGTLDAADRAKITMAVVPTKNVAFEGDTNTADTRHPTYLVNGTSTQISFASDSAVPTNAANSGYPLYQDDLTTETKADELPAAGISLDSTDWLGFAIRRKYLSDSGGNTRPPTTVNARFYFNFTSLP